MTSYFQYPPLIVLKWCQYTFGTPWSLSFEQHGLLVGLGKKRCSLSSGCWWMGWSLKVPPALRILMSSTFTARIATAWHWMCKKKEKSMWERDPVPQSLWEVGQESVRGCLAFPSHLYTEVLWCKWRQLKDPLCVGSPMKIRCCVTDWYNTLQAGILVTNLISFFFFVALLDEVLNVCK